MLTTKKHVQFFSQGQVTPQDFPRAVQKAIGDGRFADPTDGNFFDAE